MPMGKVKWFNNAKRFGFIIPDDGGRDVFVHVSALEDSGLTKLEDGARIRYDLGTSRGKTSAINLELV